jgi:histidinol-phosphate/aromatic aminotransferase/cobyric acid decarboxylase-like protein
VAAVSVPVGAGPVIPTAAAHGGDGARVAAALGVHPESVLDLSVSLNPVAPDPRPIVRRHLDALTRYPDPAEATSALARAMGVEGDRLLLTNGGAEAIALVAAEVGRGWVEDPDFALYRRHLDAVEVGAPRFRSNPHNPSGRLAPTEERAEVWDEAFFPLATGRWSRGDAEDGSIVVGSLTKLLSCPGLRLGYVLGPDPALVARLVRRQPEWSVGSLACAALPELLEGVELASWSRRIASLRSALCGVLTGRGLAARPSDANYVLVDHAAGLRAALGRSGVVVRDCTSFGLPEAVRVAVPDEEGLARLDAALGRAVAEGWEQ